LRTVKTRLLLLAVASFITLATSACGSAARHPSSAARGVRVHCSRVVAPNGHDRAAGAAAHPYRTLSRLIRSLSPGQVGCLRAGTYGGPTSLFNVTRRGITITSYPGERATIAGRPLITAAGTTLSHLNFDLNNVGNSGKACTPSGTRRPQAYGLQIEASDVTIEHDNIYQHDVPLTKRAGGIGVGYNTSDKNVVIRYNRIHDLGWCPVEDHAIYVDHASGAQVYDNWIYDIPGGTGVQLWSTTANSRIYANVIDQTASGFTLGCCAVAGEVPTRGNLIEHNVVTNVVGVQNARLDPLPPTGFNPGVTIWTHWSGPLGARNVYRNNLGYCATGLPHCGTRPGPITALVYSDNMVANPDFVDAAAHDYRVTSTSPVASWHLWDGDLGPVHTK
jgi:hypothetical protein